MAPKEVLKKYWDYDSFRPKQEEIIQHLLDGNDTLALLPTGGGKSICFQVPTLCREGINIVISPLIALMKDQVFNLKERGIKAEAIFSGMHYAQIDRILDNCVYGDVKFLYVSPERLKTDLAIERIKKMNVCFFTVDEAHCISQWGYDFRPPYLKIAEIRDLKPDVPIIALTATATEKVRKDIMDKLEFKSRDWFQTSFTRPNLSYSVLKTNRKEEMLLRILNKVDGQTIVYGRTRSETQNISDFLKKRGVSSNFYHAGLDGELKSVIQENFIKDKFRVIVATNAFGMGIDKPNVRLVIHLSPPESPEAYFQEAGRGGRDGDTAYSVLMYHDEDLKRLQNSIDFKFPPIEKVKEIYNALGSYFQLATGAGKDEFFDFDIGVFSKNFKKKALVVYNSLKILEQSELIVLNESFGTSSRVWVKLSGSELQEFRDKNPPLDIIIQTLIRATDGIFSHPVPIKEKEIAQHLKQSKDLIVEKLRFLDKSGVIQYIPRKNIPQIGYLKERLELSNLRIDEKMYFFRKNRHAERVRFMETLLTRVVCRNIQMMAYFGEITKEKCGACDVCRGKTKVNYSAEDKDRYKLKIKNLVQREKINYDELMDSFSAQYHVILSEVLQGLLDEGCLNVENDVFIWKGA